MFQKLSYLSRGLRWQSNAASAQICLIYWINNSKYRFLSLQRLCSAKFKYIGRVKYLKNYFCVTRISRIWVHFGALVNGREKEDLIRHLNSPLEITGKSNFNYSWLQEAKSIIKCASNCKNVILAIAMQSKSFKETAEQ